jgi:hypothetical protein
VVGREAALGDAGRTNQVFQLVLKRAAKYNS